MEAPVITFYPLAYIIAMDILIILILSLYHPCPEGWP